MKFWSRTLTAAAVALGLTMLAASAATPSTPTAPRNFKATGQDTKVLLTWSLPSSGTGVDYYQVILPLSRAIVTTTSYTAEGLKNGTTYSFAVRAHNSFGYGPAARTTGTPKATPPGPPTNLGATQTAPGQIRLDWTPPTSNGSMPDGSTPDIDHYDISISPGGTSHRVPASTLTYTATGLADNITYTFKVTATNTRPVTGAAATVYAPLPTGATIGLQPTAGGPAASITVTGELFLKNETIVLYWDTSTHIAASVVSDDTGAFTKVIKPFKGDKPKVHKLCANVQPKPCANFALQGPPTPTPNISPVPSPSETATPTPADTAQASGARPAGGLSGLDIITRPPFVFLPIIGIIGLVGLLAYWLLSRRRRPMAPSSSATVVHRATRPDYMAPFPPSGAAPAAPPVPTQPSAWDAPFQAPPTAQVPPPAPYAPTPYTPPQAPAPPPQPPPPVAPPPAPFAPPPAAPQPPPAPPARTVEWPSAPNPPAAPDEPPDLPQPSE
jgi:fibronectin type III domain protein